MPISQIAHLENVQEEGLIWHRNRVPTITVKGDIYSTVQAPTVTNEIMARISQDKFVENLPLGYNFAIGGSVEESAKGGASIAAGMPLYIIAVLTILMLQLQSFQRVVMVVLTAPFGLIGVTAFLLLFNHVCT